MESFFCFALVRRKRKITKSALDYLLSGLGVTATSICFSSYISFVLVICDLLTITSAFVRFSLYKVNDKKKIYYLL